MPRPQPAWSPGLIVARGLAVGVGVMVAVHVAGRSLLPAWNMHGSPPPINATAQAGELAPLAVVAAVVAALVATRATDPVLPTAFVYPPAAWLALLALLFQVVAALDPIAVIVPAIANSFMLAAGFMAGGLTSAALDLLAMALFGRLRPPGRSI